MPTTGRTGSTPGMFLPSFSVRCPFSVCALKHARALFLKSASSACFKLESLCACSGHAQKEELAEILKLVKPQHFLPVHGEASFLYAHADLARQLGCHNTSVIRNGQMLGCGEIRNNNHVSSGSMATASVRHLPLVHSCPCARWFFQALLVLCEVLWTHGRPLVRAPRGLPFSTDAPVCMHHFQR